jgi:hypothetical protein
MKDRRERLSKRRLIAIGALAIAFAASPSIGFAASDPSSPPGNDPSAQSSAKKKCKKKPKRKCKKRRAPAPAPLTPTAPLTGGGTISPPPPPPPNTLTTEELIHAAVARGEISAEQGLIYEVFAAFFDPRLPGQYQGVPDAFGHTPLDDVIAQWDQLSDSAKATLGPFLIPPFHRGSYWDQLLNPAAARAAPRADPPNPNSPWCVGSLEVVAEDWSFVEADTGPAAGKVRIWYQNRYATTDAALAANLMGAMESKIWPSLTTLMGREPLPDGGSTEGCAGGTDAIDIALVDAGTATTSSKTLSNEATPARMVFPRTLPGSWAGFHPYLAHEFLHAIQFSYSFSSGTMTSGENQWLKEGTAQWVQDYVTASQYGIGLTPNQTEHKALPFFFPHPEESLDSTSTAHHDYGSYVFWLWAVRQGNNPNLVPQVWNAVATQKSLAAAKSLFGSGWDQAWKDFTRTNWNKDGVTPNYDTWDSISDTPAVAAEGALPRDQPTGFGVQVAPVAAKYLTFQPADGIDELRYQNLGGPSAAAGVQAIISYEDGTHATEDWSQDTLKDVPACDIEELTLVFSNSSITPNDNKAFSILFTPNPPSGPTPFAATRAGVCLPPPLQGSFSGTATYTDAATTMNWTWNGTVEFEPNGQANPNQFPDHAGEVWDSLAVKTGSVTASAHGTSAGSDGECTIDAPAATYAIPAGGGSMIIEPTEPDPLYGIDLPFPINEFVDATFTCPNDSFETLIPGPGNLIYTEDPEQTDARGTYQGSGTFSGGSSGGSFSESFSWNLVITG